jgi:hypothetical protein
LLLLLRYSAISQFTASIIVRDKEERKREREKGLVVEYRVLNG